MSGIRELLNDTLAKLDAEGSLELHEVTAALEQVGKSAKESGESIDELKYEFIAAYLELCDEPNVWGTYFGPEIRVIAHGLRLSIQKRNRLGGFDLRNLGDFLADDTIAAFLTEDIVTYRKLCLQTEEDGTSETTPATVSCVRRASHQLRLNDCCTSFSC